MVRARYFKWALSALTLTLVVSITSCRQVPEEHAASDKYRLVWNDDPTSTMTIIWDQLIGDQAAVLYDKEDFGRQYWKYPNQQAPTRKLNNYYRMNTHYAKLQNLEPEETPKALMSHWKPAALRIGLLPS